MADTRPIWPNGAKAAVSVTMDNMGEAADLHRGIWPSDEPIGSHYSVQKALPKMLQLLAERGIKGTYFIESWNCTVYPEAIKDVAAHGHEIGWHAFQHEVWSRLDEDAELDNLTRSLRDSRAIGVRYKGFRPPGGMVTERTLGLLRDNGFTYLSPAAQKPAIVDGVAMVPFRWEEIDAYFYMTSTAPLRKGKGDDEDALEPRVLKKRLVERIDDLVKHGGYSAFLFHPFLQTSDEKMAVMAEVLDHLCTKKDVWIAPCHEVADWILQHPEQFGNDPGWDRAEWKKN